MKPNPTAQILDHAMEERRFQAELDRLDRLFKVSTNLERETRKAVRAMKLRRT